MFKYIASNPTDSLLRYTGKHRISNLLEKNGPYTCCSISNERSALSYKLPREFHTCHYHSTADCPGCATKRDKVDIHRINDILKVERDLHIQDLSSIEFVYRNCRSGYINTFDPTNRSTAIATLDFVPRSSYNINHQIAEEICSVFALPSAKGTAPSPS